MGINPALKKNLEQGEISPVYIFTGDDEYTKKKYEDKILKALIAACDNCDRYVFNASDSDINAAVIKDEACGISLFAVYKLIIIKESSVLFKDSSFKDFIIDFAGKKDPACTIIAEYEKTAVRGLSKKIQYSFKLPYENQMPAWIKSSFRESGKTITDEGAEYLLFFCSNNLFNIEKEIKKILLAYPGKKNYGADEVKKISANYKKDNVFNYIDALVLRRKKEALLLLDNLISYGTAPLFIIGTLRWKLQQMITVKKLMSKLRFPQTPESKILNKAGLNGYLNRGMCSNLKKYSPDRLNKSYDKLLKTDISMKSSGVDSRILMEEYSIWFMS